MGHIQLTICYICLEIAGGCKFPLIKNPSHPASLQMSALHHTQGSFGLTNTPHHTHTHNLRVSYFIMVIIQMYASVWTRILSPNSCLTVVTPKNLNIMTFFGPNIIPLNGRVVFLISGSSIFAFVFNIMLLYNFSLERRRCARYVLLFVRVVIIHIYKHTYTLVSGWKCMTCLFYTWPISEIRVLFRCHSWLRIV